MTAATIVLGPLDLALVATLVLVNAGVSLAFRLGLERPLLLAAVRAAAQLALLGYLLQWIFDLGRVELVLALALAMAALAGVEAARRSEHRARGQLPLALAVMGSSSIAVTLFGLVAILRTDPWWEPRYLVPILGMVLGNTLNGISLGLDSVLAGFVRERERVEMLLAHGVERRDAVRSVVRRAVRTATVPVVNMMVAAGLISIPGMMTGQILAGESPARAAAYQIFILFLIAGGVALGTVGAVLGSVRLVFDERDRLRIDRIDVRPS